MRTRLTKVGNSHAIILGKETLELLGVLEGGEVEMQVLGKVLTLHAPDLESAEVRAAMAFGAVLAEDAEVLERLADA
jgi:antitoxin component of MazEF toxin-antitoxin module